MKLYYVATICCEHTTPQGRQCTHTDEFRQSLSESDFSIEDFATQAKEHFRKTWSIPFATEPYAPVLCPSCKE